MAGSPFSVRRVIQASQVVVGEMFREGNRNRVLF